MMDEPTPTQNEKLLAGLAHGSIVLAPLTNGLGGIAASLVIWLVQREKSAYVAGQAVQALAYQALTLIVTMLAWCCWGALWMVLLLPPILVNPAAYETTPPPGLWIGLILMLVPVAIWGLTILYGIWGAVRALGGHDFKYAIIGKWLTEQQREAS
jgi:uncharacterized Tic20 family protein